MNIEIPKAIRSRHWTGATVRQRNTCNKFLSFISGARRLDAFSKGATVFRDDDNNGQLTQLYFRDEADLAFLLPTKPRSLRYVLLIVLSPRQ